MSTWIDRLQGINVYLIGLMGSGKTTTGQHLAKQLGYRFFDTDRVIEQAAQQTIAELFQTFGEATFRELETNVLSELAAYRRLVIATGGGIVMRRQNWSYLRHGIVIWLDVPVEQISRRLQGDRTRPLLEGKDPVQTLESLLAQRQSLYAQADVHLIPQAEESPQQTVDRILEAIPTVLKPELTPLYPAE